MPRILLGVVLILVLALAGAMVAKRVDTRLPVLATARAVGAGQTITADDVKVVRVAADAGVATMPASELSTVVGHTATVPLVAGALMSPAQVGTTAWPPPGQAVTAVAVKPGHAPSGLAAGAHVNVLVVPTGGATVGTGPGAGQTVQAEATVVSVEAAADQSGISVVTLLLGTQDATRVASAAGDAALVQLGAGR